MNKIHLQSDKVGVPVCHVQNGRRIGTSLMIVEDIQYVTCARCKGEQK